MAAVGEIESSLATPHQTIQLAKEVWQSEGTGRRGVEDAGQFHSSNLPRSLRECNFSALDGEDEALAPRQLRCLREPELANFGTLERRGGLSSLLRRCRLLFVAIASAGGGRYRRVSAQQKQLFRILLASVKAQLSVGMTVPRPDGPNACLDGAEVELWPGLVCETFHAYSLATLLVAMMELHDLARAFPMFGTRAPVRPFAVAATIGVVVRVRRLAEQNRHAADHDLPAIRHEREHPAVEAQIDAAAIGVMLRAALEPLPRVRQLMAHVDEPPAVAWQAAARGRLGGSSEEWPALARHDAEAHDAIRLRARVEVVVLARQLDAPATRSARILERQITLIVEVEREEPGIILSRGCGDGLSCAELAHDAGIVRARGVLVCQAIRVVARVAASLRAAALVRRRGQSRIDASCATEKREPAVNAGVRSRDARDGQ